MPRNPYLSAMGWIASVSLFLAVFPLIAGASTQGDPASATIAYLIGGGLGMLGLSWGSTWLIMAALTYKAPVEAKTTRTPVLASAD